MSKVSVIIPSFNNATYLAESLESALGQTYKDLEVILVDDGSTDNTQEVVKPYAGRVRYLYQENQGPAAARNRGIREASGEFIAFLDADDIWKSNKIEKQLRNFESHPEIGFVYCDNDFVDFEGRLIQFHAYEPILKRGNLVLDLFCRYFIMTPSIVIRRTCFDRVGLFNEALRVGEDYEFFLKLAYFYLGDVIEEKLWMRRVVAGSLSRKDFVLDAESDLATLKRFLKERPDFFTKNRARVVQRLADYHFSFAYHCLEKGKNLLAFLNLLASLRYNFSLKTFQNILLCGLPFSLRKSLKEKRGSI